MKIYVVIVLLLVSICSCNSYPPQAKSDKVTPFEAIGITPRADTLKPAHVTILDTCKAPRVIAIPAQPMTLILKTDKGKDTLHLSPPQPKTADFCTPMVTYSSEYGLYSSISYIQRDHSGHIWLATYGGGVSRYDGKTFTTFTSSQGLASNVVYCIAEDRHGNMWIGTDAGVSRYDGKTFKTYASAQGLAGDRVIWIMEDKSGNLWLATTDGLSCYKAHEPDGREVRFINYTIAQGLPANRVNCMAEDRSGHLWLGTSAGLSKWEGHPGDGAVAQFTTYTTAQGLAHNKVWRIREDKYGDLWLATSGGVSHVEPHPKDGGIARFTTLTTAQGLADNDVTDIMEDNSGNLWFATQEGGLSRYEAHPNDSAAHFTTFTTAQGLASNSVNTIAKDKSGSLWFGTYGGGVSRYDGQTFVTYAKAQGLGSNGVLNIAEDRSGNFWFGTSGGVTCYEEHPKSGGAPRFTTYTVNQGLANNVVLKIAQDRSGNFWFGTNVGVSYFDGKTFTSYTSAQGLAEYGVWSILEDDNGDVWFGTGRGVSRYKAHPKEGGVARFTTYTTAQGLVNNDVTEIIKDKSGNLWIGTSGGVSRYDGKNFTNYTTAQGLVSNVVSCIIEDKSGNLWVGTYGEGVSRYDGKSFTTFTRAQGLANNSVKSIAEDQLGHVWFGTNEGFSVLKSFTATGNTKPQSIPADNNFSNQKIYENYSPVFEKYNVRNGCPVRDCNSNAMLVDSKGIIWAGTGDKLVRFDYSNKHRDSTPPQVFINAIKIGGEAVCWHDLYKMTETKLDARGKEDSMAIINEEVETFVDVLPPAKRLNMQEKFRGIHFDSISRFYPIPFGLVLPYLHNNITFDFGALELARPYLVNYQYMLQGYEKDWNPITDRSTATFGNIHEGTYTFKLKAQGPDGVWCEPITYIFKVLPPWYRTWWAYLIYALAGIYALYVIVKWRTRLVIKEKERLEKVVAERTEDVVKKNNELELKNIEIANEKAEVERQRQRSDELLLNILPEEVASELKDHGNSAARHYDNVTVLFTDFVNFTNTSGKMSPQVLIDELHTCFKTFDEITERYGIEKIKTIGDAYMAVAGLPSADPRHGQNVVKAAGEMMAYMNTRYKQIGDKTFRLRIGIHSGGVVAGIVGVKKFAYDIWGDTVNTAARMEQNCEPGRINISEATYELVKDKFNCEYRGEIEAKGKGKLKMYYVG